MQTGTVKGPHTGIWHDTGPKAVSDDICKACKLADNTMLMISEGVA